MNSMKKSPQEIAADALFEKHLQIPRDLTVDYNIFLGDHLRLEHKNLSFWQSLTVLTKRSYRIAIVVPYRSHFSRNEVSGFLKYLQNEEGLRIIPSIYNINGSTPVLRDYIMADLYKKQYDLIHAIGRQCTQEIAEFFKHQPMRIPLLFSSIDNPERLNLDRTFVAGMSSTYTTLEHVEALLKAKPEMKKVGLLYNPTDCGGASETYSQEMTFLFEQHDIVVSAQAVYSDDQILPSAKSLIQHGVDSLVTLPGGFIEQKMGAIAHMCSTAGVTLCGSSIYAILDGAVIGFGYPEQITGKLVAQKAAAILRDKMSPFDVNIHPTATQSTIFINSSIQERQGLPIDSERSRRWAKHGFSVI